MNRRLFAAAAAVTLALGAFGGPASAAGADTGGKGHAWVGSWEASPTADTADNFANYSLRNVVHLSTGGLAVRLRLSNEFGTRPLVLGHVTVALQAAGANSAAARPGTVRDVRFAGHRSTTVAAGADVRSDPVALPVPARANLLVTVYLPAQAGAVTYHALAEQTSFASPSGDHAADTAGTAYTREIFSWYYLTGVDVLNPAARGSVVTLGDSITDSYQSTWGANHRWPDFLAGRILSRPGAAQLGVQNAGISGNRLLLPGLVDAFGPPAWQRLDEDVLSRTGARTVIVLLGINDIQQPPHQTDPAVIDAALREIAVRAHRAGLRVIGGTLTPWEGWPGYDATLEAVRVAVNHFIHTSRAFDAVVDFDAAVRDPADPHRMLAAYDSGDHLHPNDAGYEVMAASVDVRQL
ncbi:MAG: hypothetical protein V7603_103 [Micromonosporaceae bacterium]